MTSTTIACFVSAPSEKMRGSMLSFQRQHKRSVHAVSLIRPYRNGHDTLMSGHIF